MKRYRNGEIWDFEHDVNMVAAAHCNGRCPTLCLSLLDLSLAVPTTTVLELHGRARNPTGMIMSASSAVTTCHAMMAVWSILLYEFSAIPGMLAKDRRRAYLESAARETLEQVMADALARSASTRSAVEAVCLSVSGVNHPTDQHRIINWLRFASQPVDNGKLHGCVLIAGTGTIAYGFTEDGREARAAGAGPVLGDWGSGYGIAAQALTAVIRAHDGRGPETTLTHSILDTLNLSSPDELIGWTYSDPSWARIAALVPVVVSCADAGDPVANNILHDTVHELASSVRAVVERLELCGEDGKDPFPLVMVGGVLEANRRWDIGNEVISCISGDFPGVLPIRPKVEPAVGAALLAWNFLMRQRHQEALGR
ncbi:UNVERIFIED_CONTAM: N-acetyl-D-glucosamine kinase [Sesamum calycinum]|uniref:N-acetyl-D-glucosamine kinase n=1 Tax=Sesamum calycinum TaxID=2727403 RepID=A0AAW2M941_9LAMI